MIRTSKMSKEETICEGAYNCVAMTVYISYITTMVSQRVAIYFDYKPTVQIKLYFNVFSYVSRACKLAEPFVHCIRMQGAYHSNWCVMLQRGSSDHYSKLRASHVSSTVSVLVLSV